MHSHPPGPSGLYDPRFEHDSCGVSFVANIILSFPVLVLYARRILELSGTGFGLLLSAGAVGGIMGAASAARVTARAGRAAGLTGSLAVAAAAFRLVQAVIIGSNLRNALGAWGFANKAVNTGAAGAAEQTGGVRPGRQVDHQLTADERRRAARAAKPRRITWRVLLFVVQTTLVAQRKVAVHRRLGFAGAGLAAAMVGVGTYTAIEAAARGSAPPGVDPLAFLAIPLFDIVLFTIYGAVLEYSGAGQFFLDWSFSALGRSKSGAGPGRTVTAAGFLLGTVSGSGVATTVMLGSVAWPILRRAKYSAETAGAMLSAAGIGALLSPPTLGAAAFLIAEFLQISYLQVLERQLKVTMFARDALDHYLKARKGISQRPMEALNYIRSLTRPAESAPYKMKSPIDEAHQAVEKGLRAEGIELRKCLVRPTRRRLLTAQRRRARSWSLRQSRNRLTHRRK